MGSTRADVRRAYELGRLRGAASRSAFIVAPVAAFSAVTVGLCSLTWLPFTFGAWLLAFWHGGELERGARWGLAAGLMSLLLPLWVLRSCVEGCARAGCCVLSGAEITVVVVAVVPLARSSWWKTIAGTAVGALSVATLWCSALDRVDAVAFVSGVLAGPFAVSVVRGVHTSWFRV